MKSKNVSIGLKVLVFDRYRFAVPLIGVVFFKSKVNDGVKVELMQSNNPNYPIGSKVWVHAQQLKRTTQPATCGGLPIRPRRVK